MPTISHRGEVMPASPIRKLVPLANKAKEKGINNIIAEVTFGNVYSLRNLKDLGYEEKTWYEKDGGIKRYILLKKLGETENE